jgi:hypothetical protein
MIYQQWESGGIRSKIDGCLFLNAHHIAEDLKEEKI